MPGICLLDGFNLNNFIMISDAIQTILTAAGHSSFAHIAIDPDNDMPMPPRPFVVHKEQQVEVIRSKDGIEGYVYEVALSIIDEEMESVNAIGQTLTTLMENTEGTFNNTIIELITDQGNDGVQQDEARAPYYDTLHFKVETLNK